MLSCVVLLRGVVWHIVCCVVCVVVWFCVVS